MEAAVGDKVEKRGEKRKRFSKEGLEILKSSYDKRGICYLGYIPPGMRPHILQRILSEYGEITRVHLQTEDPRMWRRRKSKGGDRRRFYTEGWVEFSDKRIAKRTATMLNGEPMGGKHRSRFFHENWCLKYLPKFKWEDLQEGIEYQKHLFQHRLQAELSQAKKDQEFYLSKVNQAQQAEKAEKSVEDVPEDDIVAQEDKVLGSQLEDETLEQAQVSPGKRKKVKKKKKQSVKRYFNQTKAQPDPVLESDGSLSLDVMKLVAGLDPH